MFVTPLVTRRSASSAVVRRVLVSTLVALVAWVSSPASASAPAAAPARKAAGAVILVLGDSLSAEYGLPRGTGWVQLLTERLRSSGANYTVVNASISGETTSGGRTRLPVLLQQHRPAIVLLELGANDGLRGLPLATMRDNLAVMIRLSQQAGAAVLLIGVRVPPNYGRDYSERFFQVFADLARDERIAFAPFLLDGFAESLDYFQADRIHPNEKAQARMLDNVWPQLRPLLRTRPAAAR
jgi:acyl-CoA thioesterase-1